MVAYFLLLLVPIIPAFLFSKYKKDKYRVAAISCFFIFLTLLLTFRRNDIGIDLSTYKYHFNRIGNSTWDNLTNFNTEIGYVILNKISSTITPEYQFFLLVTAIISVVPIFIMYIKESKTPYLSIILFVNMSTFVMLFSGLRQAIAISLGTIAFYFVKNHKIFYFIAIVLLAILFHQSAFVLFVMYPLYHSKITKKWLWFVIPGVLIILIFNKQIFGFLINLLSNKYIERYASIRQTGAYAMIALFAMFLLFSYLIVDDKNIDATTLGLRNIMVLVLIIQLFAPIHTLAMRFNYYFIIFVPILISRIVATPKPNLKGLAKISHVVMVCFFTFYFFYNAYTGADILQVYPYRFFWE